MGGACDQPTFASFFLVFLPSLFCGQEDYYVSPKIKNKNFHKQTFVSGCEGERERESEVCQYHQESVRCKTVKASVEKKREGERGKNELSLCASLSFFLLSLIL